MPSSDELADALFGNTGISWGVYDTKLVSLGELRTLARDAAKQALLDTCEVLDDVDPDDIRTWLRTRAEQIGEGT